MIMTDTYNCERLGKLLRVLEIIGPRKLTRAEDVRDRIKTARTIELPKGENQ